jgi:hypothetical protein
MDVHPELGALRWMDAMRAWAGRGGPGERWKKAPGWGRAPPGVDDIKPWTSPLRGDVTIEGLVRPGRSKGKQDTYGRDYVIKNTAYYLRPEVRGASSPRVCVLSLVFGVADGRIVLHPMANDGRHEMASSWLACLPSHPTPHQDRLGVHQRRKRAHRPSNLIGLDAEVSRRQFPFSRSLATERLYSTPSVVTFWPKRSNTSISCSRTRILSPSINGFLIPRRTRSPCLSGRHRRGRRMGSCERTPSI